MLETRASPGTRQDQIISTVDPEMRLGRKNREQVAALDGYKIHAATTNASEPLITAIEAHRLRSGLAQVPVLRC